MTDISAASAYEAYSHSAPKTPTGWAILLIGWAILLVLGVWQWKRASARAQRQYQQYQEEQARSATASPGAPAGWYPVANDPASLRYFDGRNWTSNTKPRE